MRIQILGSAAGGGFPQWNCGCENCVAVRKNASKNARENKFSGKARTQAQLALSADGSTWFLAGASPDLAFQIESSPQLHPRALRDSPVAGVVLASGDLDHVVGLLLLRELQPLRVYAAPSILRILREENSMFGMLNRVEPQVVWTPMNSGAPFPLLSVDGKDSGLQCEVHYLSGRYPKYVKTETKVLARDEATAALFFVSSSGKRVAYVPAVGSLSDWRDRAPDGAHSSRRKSAYAEQYYSWAQDVRSPQQHESNPERGESRTSGRAPSRLGSGGR